VNIGLFGGSFDPVHKGHFHLSDIAIKSLQLSQIWWLVSTRNPLKSKNQEKSVLDRLKKIKKKNRNYKVHPMALELKLKTYYSYDTISYLKKRFPNVNFFWIIGADNLFILHKWYKWRQLFYMCPIVVFDRPNYFYKSISSKAAKYFWRYRIDIKSLKNSKSYFPKWSYVKIKLDNSSSSSIRKQNNN
tara:strand:- start:1443 stop:2006 length:564 start_codon:yes stop_codon:yes gene_type:complete